jgi:hypothetical protein
MEISAAGIDKVEALAGRGRESALRTVADPHGSAILQIILTSLPYEPVHEISLLLSGTSYLDLLLCVEQKSYQLPFPPSPRRLAYLTAVLVRLLVCPPTCFLQMKQALGKVIVERIRNCCPRRGRPNAFSPP